MSQSLLKRTSFPIKIPLWSICIFSAVLCAFLAYKFHSDEVHIARNGDVQQYRMAALALIHPDEVSSINAAYYPPLANIVFVVAFLESMELPFHRSMIVLMIFCLLCAVIYIYSWLKPSDLRWFIFSILLSIVLLEPSVFFARFDFFPMLTILLACLSFRQKRYASAGGFLMAGVLLKFSPIFLFPLFHILTPAKKRIHFWKGATIVLVLVFALFAVISRSSLFIYLENFSSLRAGHPVYALATASSIDLFLRMLFGSSGHIKWLDPNLGHFNVGLPIFMPALLLICSVLGALYIAYAAMKNNGKEHIFLYASAVLLWLLFMTPLLTMHYYLWVLPLLFFWFFETVEQRGIQLVNISIALLAITVALLGQYFYPYAYFDLVDRQTHITVTLNFVRNALVFVLLFFAMHATVVSKKHVR